MASSSSNVVGVHYRVGKKIGEGSFGVIFEYVSEASPAVNKLRNISEEQTCSTTHKLPSSLSLVRATLHSYAMSTELTKSLLDAVSTSRSVDNAGTDFS